MQRFIWMAVFLLGVQLQLKAQLENIQITEDPMVHQMMEKFISINKATTRVPGWRIQLLATTDRRKVEQEKIRFQSLYPGMYVDWTHSNPYYKLRAGAFADRLDLYRMMHRIKEHFPSSYPARDLIKKEATLN